MNELSHRVLGCFHTKRTLLQVDDLLIIEEKIDLEVRSLETCMYDHKTFSEILNRVQKAVDDLNLHSYSNLPIWVNKLDMEVCMAELASH
jgi:hypothetical protein